MPPDVLEIFSPTSQELDGESQLIRPDGKISLKLVGEVKVAGLTPTEIAHKLEKQLETYYVNPKVNVRVANGLSKRYYVFGEVNSPGAYTYTGSDSLIRALALSQPNFLAWRSQIKVIRPSPDRTQRRELVVDVDEIVKHGKMENNVLLQEGDIIYVPPTPTAWVGLRLRELLYPVPPVAGSIATPVDLASTGARYNQPIDQQAGRTQVTSY